MKKIAFVLLMIGAPLYAQSVEDYWQSNWAIGPHLVISLPQDDFANVSKTGEGIGAKVLYKIGSIPYLVPRLDFAYISYGEERGDPFFASYYAMVQTRNEAFQLTLGPQIQRKYGRFMPYMSAMGGLYVYRKVTSYTDAYSYYDPYGGYGYADTKFSLTKFGWNVNAGVKLDLNLGPFVDLNIRYQTINDGVKRTAVDESGVEHTQVFDAKDFTITLGVVFFLKEY